MSDINDTKWLPEDILHLNLKSINQYQCKYPSLMARYNNCKYKTGSFCIRSNINIDLITCYVNIVIQLILQSYVLHWYQIHILSSVMDRAKTMIRRHLYWPIIGYAVLFPETYLAATLPGGGVPGRGLKSDQPPGSLCAPPCPGQNSDTGGREPTVPQVPQLWHVCVTQVPQCPSLENRLL